MKRKAHSLEGGSLNGKAKRRAVGHRHQFREGLFDQVDGYTKSYANSTPYRYGIIQDLVSPTLLRNVRAEIQELSFTPKETDIYKIHQSGDLANLNGLDDSSLKRLPSLLSLRDAMYSSEFRDYLSHITGSGPLSGKKADMAINVYTPGCHLLCHDDVIGSRRVSYILYLTDPDVPWKKEWGGALRLYPTQGHTDKDGQVTKVPSPDFSVSIPPAFNQLSFFAVQPGESYHDVEEVYSQTALDDDSKNEQRVRMAISGWYHIPQEGEEGYEEGLEERLAEKSSLMQLQGKDDRYDLPQPNVQLYPAIIEGSGMPTPSPEEDLSLSEKDCDFLLKYIAPTYLTPDTLDSVSNIFADDCSMCLENFLSRKFSASIKTHIQSQESQNLPTHFPQIEESTPWTVARPPHKHRFLFQTNTNPPPPSEPNPILDLIHTLLPSSAFQRWLSLATGHTITSHDTLLRRFRRGHDYTLATGYEEQDPRIELCLGLTPTSGWGGEDEIRDEEGAERVEKDDNTASKDASNSVGGYLAYMVGDDDDDDSSSDAAIEIPPSMNTGARSSKPTNPPSKKPKRDPAIYQSHADDDDEDDGVLFSMPASWNRLGIVLRDRGTMRFVKYVSRMAAGDRWDLVGEFGIADVDGEEGEAVEGAEDAVSDDTDVERELESEESGSDD